MRVTILGLIATVAIGGCMATGQNASVSQDADAAELMASAKAAAPTSITEDATIMTWDGEALIEGTNGYTCMPDNPNNTGADPMCLDESWMNLLSALTNNEDPSYDEVGVAYMLAGDAEVSNTDPYATEFTSHDDWVAGLGAHLMILVPGKNSLEGFSTDPYNGGPWVMWPGTPYEHLMVPIESFGR